ncbi:hypothetical protein AVEN_17718-1 [Araneus ventricosus]|uniref:Uncharacterized protein n=1 Tax=Araneus ventricosus TaxID=182803 RepID=A0A4Y2FAL7_ARAVE|nr:hypothetical protein AVEN_17718-1 [Araneus ventricosus]
MKYDESVSHTFSISLIALEDCCCAVISSSVKFSSIISCCETQYKFISSSVVRSWLWSSISSQISFLSTSNPLILAKDTISLTIGSTGTASDSSKSHSTTLSAKASSNQK